MLVLRPLQAQARLLCTPFGWPGPAPCGIWDVCLQVKTGQIKTGEQMRSELKGSIVGLLTSRGGSSELAIEGARPAVLLVVGVNGGGKTTTVGKLAHKFASGGAKVVLGAGDTFRAAAAEQLEEWARRSGAEIVRAASEKARPDTVLFQV